MAATTDREMHTLVLTGPARDLLYEHFAWLYRHSSDVRVVKDRRGTERRRDQMRVEGERRRRERRAAEPWLFPSH
jgi:hypothetical protein